MAKNSIPVPANGEMIRWTRRHSKKTVSDVLKVTKLARLNEDRVEAIESGKQEATIAEILEFSRIYKRPFAYFFLSKTPPEIPEIVDNRTGAAYGSDTGGDLGMAISRAYEIQDLAVDFSAVLGTPFKDVPTPPAQSKSDPEKLASWLQGQMGISKMFGGTTLGPREVLEKWLAAVEGLGIITLQETFSPKDSSAFSVGNLRPPILVLCFKDAERRRLFSLFHEVAHIILRQSAICELALARPPGEERFCDKFSASFLMPRDEVHDVVARFGSDNLDLLAKRLSTLSGASAESAFLRLVDLRITNMDEYWQRKPAWEAAYADWLLKQKKRKGGPNPNPVGTAIRKNGRTLSSFVSEAFRSGQISRAEASYIARLPAREIPNLVKRIK